LSIRGIEQIFRVELPISALFDARI